MEDDESLHFQVYKCQKLDVLPEIVVSIYVFVKCDCIDKGLYLQLL